MDITLLILVVLVSLAVIVALLMGGKELLFSGFLNVGRLVQTVWLRLMLGFILGGFIAVRIPSSLVTEWLGPASGLKGIIIASYTGVIIGGGGPYIAMPVLVSFMVAGADIGPVIALLTAWNLLGLRSLFIWQMPFLGVKLALSRYVACLIFPPIAGILGGLIYQLMTSG